MSLIQLVEEITKPFIQEGINDSGILKAVFLAGGPGSGKGYVSKGLFGIPKSISVSAYGLKVVNQDKALTNSRLNLICSVKLVLANGLKILGISAPERM